MMGRITSNGCVRNDRLYEMKIHWSCARFYMVLMGSYVGKTLRMVIRNRKTLEV